jgi:hypothetical protein
MEQVLLHPWKHGFESLPEWCCQLEAASRVSGEPSQGILQGATHVLSEGKNKSDVKKIIYCRRGIAPSFELMR